jgi:hypothetical protein
MLSGHVFRRQMWAPAIGVIGGGVLPTPAACLPNDGERPETWLARREKVKAKGINGNGMGMPLSIAAQLLPTPKAADGERGRDKARTRPDTKGRELATVVRDQLLPTPTAGDAKNRGYFYGPVKDGLRTWNPSLPGALGAAKTPKPLPTPTTNDSKNASLPPSQAERDGLAGAMLRDDSIPTGAATYLNPSFVEEMMGFPVGWTA